MTSLITSSGFSLSPTSLDEAIKMAELMSASEMVPKDYQGKPGNVLVAVQMGAELGLKPVQSLQNIAVVNGRPSIWGDGLRALIMSAPDLVDIKDEFDSNTMTATCTITRQINGNHLPFAANFRKRMRNWPGFGDAIPGSPTPRKCWNGGHSGLPPAKRMRTGSKASALPKKPWIFPYPGRKRTSHRLRRRLKKSWLPTSRTTRRRFTNRTSPAGPMPSRPGAKPRSKSFPPSKPKAS